MAISTRLLTWLPPLLAAGSMAHAQSAALALVQPVQQTSEPAPARPPAAGRRQRRPQPDSGGGGAYPAGC